MNTDSNKKDNIKTINLDEDLDLSRLIRLFLRNKKFIVSLSLLSLLLSCVYALFTKRVWEGQFQIVLDQKEDNSFTSLINNQGLGNLIFDKSNSNNLDTQVAILESPSVLMPIFDFVNEIYRKDKSNMKSFSFKKWKKESLKINLEEGTSVLNIIYRDKKKDIILPILEKVSKTYQDYSTRNKIRMMSLNKKFLEEQISIYKQKSLSSFKKAQEFAIENDLEINNSYLYQEPNNLNEKLNKMQQNLFNKNIKRNIDIESIRVTAANTIRNIDAQIEKINELGNDYEQIQYIGSMIPNVVAEGLPLELKDVESKLFNQRLKYKDQDISVINLKKKREFLISLLKDRSIGYLKAEKLSQQAIMESASRPKEVLIVYKELLRQATRDEATLINLENDFALQKLKESTFKDPWELITKPTLLSYPVAPNRKNIAVIGLFFGFLLGVLISIINEFRSGLIFENKIIEKIFDTKIIDEINFENFDTKQDNDEYLIEDIILNNPETKHTFFYHEKTNLEILKNIKEKLSEIGINQKNIIIESNINNLDPSTEIFYFVSMKSAFEEELKLRARKFKIRGIKLKGIINIKK